MTDSRPVIREWLVEHFGYSAMSIVGIRNPHLGGCHFSNAAFVIDDDGGTFVSCGMSEVLVSFSGPAGDNIRGVVYLVRDTEDLRASEKKRSDAHMKARLHPADMTATDWKAYHSSTARPKLRLAYSI